MYDTDASERRRGRGRKREEEERWRRRAGQGATKPPLPRNQAKRCPLGRGPIILRSDPSYRHERSACRSQCHACAHFMFESRISKPTAEDYFSHLIKQRVSRFDDEDGGDNRILPCSDCCCCCRAFRRRCHSRVPCELPDHDACLPDFRAGVATYPLTLLALSPLDPTFPLSDLGLDNILYH